MHPPTPDEMRLIVHTAATDGDPLDAIERDMIEPAAISDDAKSGLWLYAWSSAGLRRGRHEAPPLVTRLVLD